jgi:hypothetical protein
MPGIFIILVLRGTSQAKQMANQEITMNQEINRNPKTKISEFLVKY